MKNRNIITGILVLLFLSLQINLQVNISNTEAKEEQIDHSYFVTDAFTEKFSGTYNAKAFVGPDNAFEVVNASIHSATTSFYLEVYTLSSENLVNSLIYADGQGVDVVVLLEQDHVSGYEDDYTAQAAYDLNAAGVEVLWTTTDYTFTHAKFWVVDTQYTYVYSGNWAPSSMPADTDARTNREMGLMFDDSDVATFYEDIFWEDYAKATSYSAGSDPGHGYQAESSGTYVPVKANPLNLNEYMEIIPIFSPNNSYTMLKSLIDNATTTLEVQQQYLTHTCALTYDIIDAANRGVDVRVLYPEPTTSSKNVTEILLQNGVKVRFSKSLYNHNKFVKADDEIVAVSSINWSNGSVVDNREAGAIVKNTNIATYLGDVFEYDWENYSEVPTGYVPEVKIIDPTLGYVASDSVDIEAGFYVGPFTSGELYVDTSLVKTWSTPLGTATYNLDVSAYDDGIHTLKIVGKTTGTDYEDEVDINIINADDWKVLISEVRFDANTEPAGEFFEIFNAYDFNVLIGGWTVTDYEDDYIIPDDTIIGAIDMLIFVRDEATFTTEMNDLGITSVTPDLTYTDLLLANSGDELILEDTEGNIRDAVIWGSATLSGHTAWTGTMTDQLSLHRDPANADTNDCSVDFVADTPDPGTVTITVNPSGFLPGFALVSSIIAIGFVTIVIGYRRRRKM